MMTAEVIGFPVQETSREETSSAMDSGYYTETPLSTEETPYLRSGGQHPKICEESNASTRPWNGDIKTSQEIKVYNSGSCAIEDCGQDNMDFSCDTVKSNNASETFEDKGKTFEGASTEESASIDLRDSNAQEAMRSDDHTMTCALENNLSPEGHILHYHSSDLYESGHNGDVGSAPSDDILAHHEVSDSFSAASPTGGNASNSKIDDDTDILIPHCKTQIMANILEEVGKEGFAESDPSTACSESDKNAFTGPEDKTSTERGGDDKDLLCCRPNINETDAKEESKAFDGHNLKDIASTGLQQVSDVTDVSGLDDQTSMILKSEDSTTAISQENNFATEGLRSNNTATELLESEHNSDVGSGPIYDNLTHHEVSNNFSAASHSGGNASNSKIDDDTDILIPHCKTQIMANILEEVGKEDFAESDPSTACSESDKNAFTIPEDKTSSERGGDDKDLLCRRSNNNETDAKEESKAFDGHSLEGIASTGLQQVSDVTDVIGLDDHTILKSEDSTAAISEENNFETEGLGSNNTATELLEPGHNGDVGSAPINNILAHHEVSDSFSAASHTGGNASNSKIDDDTDILIPHCKTQIMANILEEVGKEDCAKSDPSPACSEYDKNAFKGPEDKTSTERGGDDKDLLCRRPNNNETDAEEEESRAFDGHSLEGIASTGLQQVSDVTDVIGLDDQTILKSEDSTKEISEENNFATEGLGSNNTATELIDPGCNGDVGSAPSDDILAHHEVKDSIVGACQTGGSIDHGCNQSTSIFRSDEGTNKAADIRRGNNRRRRGNKTSTNHEPEDNISSGHGRDNNGLSDHKPNSQDQTRDTQKNSLAATNPACFHQDGIVPIAINDHVSLTHGSEICNSSETKLDKRRHSGRTSRIYKYIWNQSVFWITTMMMVLMAPILVQASPPEWKWCWFCVTNGSLINQVLTIRMGMSDWDCTFNFATSPFSHDCSRSGSSVYAKNNTCVHLLTDNLSSDHCHMEHGSVRNGDSLPAGGCETLNETSMMKKIAEYITSAESTEPPDGSAKPQLDEDSTRTVWIVGAVLGVLGVFGLVVFLALLYKRWQTFKRLVNTVVRCGRHGNITTPATGANTDQDPSAIALMPTPSTNGDINRPPDEERPE